MFNTNIPHMFNSNHQGMLSTIPHLSISSSSSTGVKQDMAASSSRKPLEKRYQYPIALNMAELEEQDKLLENDHQEFLSQPQPPSLHSTIQQQQRLAIPETIPTPLPVVTLPIYTTSTVPHLTSPMTETQSLNPITVLPTTSTSTTATHTRVQDTPSPTPLPTPSPLVDKVSQEEEVAREREKRRKEQEEEEQQQRRRLELQKEQEDKERQERERRYLLERQLLEQQQEEQRKKEEQKRQEALLEQTKREQQIKKQKEEEEQIERERAKREAEKETPEQKRQREEKERIIAETIARRELQRQLAQQELQVRTVTYHVHYCRLQKNQPRRSTVTARKRTILIWILSTLMMMICKFVYTYIHT
jgi:hypothetical protein